MTHEELLKRANELGSSSDISMCPAETLHGLVSSDLREAARGVAFTLLVPSTTSAGWWQKAHNTARVTLLLSGGEVPLTLFCFGGQALGQKFRKAFQGHGVFVCPCG